jgi:hypothetical protein
MAVSVNIDTFYASTAQNIITDTVERVIRIEQFLQAHTHEGIIVLGDKALENAELHGRAKPFKDFMNFCPSSVIFDIVGNKDKLHE